MLQERKFVLANNLTDLWNKKIVFTTNDVCKIGLNIPSNRFRSVSNMIEKEWLCNEKQSFKLKAKIHIIQNALQRYLFKYAIKPIFLNCAGLFLCI